MHSHIDNGSHNKHIAMTWCDYIKVWSNTSHYKLYIHELVLIYILYTDKLGMCIVPGHCYIINTHLLLLKHILYNVWTTRQRETSFLYWENRTHYNICKGRITCTKYNVNSFDNLSINTWIQLTTFNFEVSLWIVRQMLNYMECYHHYTWVKYYTLQSALRVT